AHDVAEPFCFLERDVAFDGGGRRAVAQIQIGAYVESQDFAQVDARLKLHVRVQKRTLGVGDGKVDGDGVRILARSDSDAAVTAAAASAQRQQHGGQRPRVCERWRSMRDW